MARINRSEFVAHAELSAARVAARGRAERNARNVLTFCELVRRLPRLFVIAATVAAVIVAASAHI